MKLAIELGRFRSNTRVLTLIQKFAFSKGVIWSDGTNTVDLDFRGDTPKFMYIKFNDFGRMAYGTRHKINPDWQDSVVISLDNSEYDRLGCL